MPCVTKGVAWGCNLCGVEITTHPALVLGVVLV